MRAGLSLSVVATAVLVCLLALSPANALIDPPNSTYTGTLNKIYTTAAFNFLGKIDGASQQFLSDVYFTFAWCDDRLATKLKNNVAFSETTDWSPVVEYVNGLAVKAQIAANPYSITAQSPFSLSDDDPNVKCKAWGSSAARYYSSMIATLDLKQFPFDSQLAELKMESSLYTADQVTFVPAGAGKTFDDISSLMLPDGFTVIEWNIQGQGMKAVDYTYDALQQTYSRLTTTVSLKRQPAFYVNKFIIIAVLIIAMILLLFSLTPDVPVRITTCMSGYMSLVNLTFVSSNNVPKLSYMTRLDQFMIFNFFMVFGLAMCYSLLYLNRLFDLQATAKLAAAAAEAAKAAAKSAVEMVSLNQKEGVPNVPAGSSAVAIAAPVKADPPKPTGFWATMPKLRKIDFVLFFLFSAAYTIIAGSIIRG